MLRAGRIADDYASVGHRGAGEHTKMSTAAPGIGFNQDYFSTLLEDSRIKLYQGDFVGMEPASA